jgi:hypothetical protein
MQKEAQPLPFLLPFCFLLYEQYPASVQNPDTEAKASKIFYTLSYIHAYENAGLKIQVMAD